LCGGYNARVIQAVRAHMAELASAGREPVLSVAGRKGLAYFRYHDLPVLLPIHDLDENVSFHRLGDAARDIMERFSGKDIDAVEVISTRYRTRVHQDVVRAPLLPLRAAQVAAGPVQAPDGSPLYLVEPGHAAALAALLPLLVETEIFCVALEAMLCEQAQRSMAMRSASDNADSMTRRLTRSYNRVRQAQITNEMIEIISGSEGGRT
jgi:F-type H+-transporting ATPase subunit gamma